MLIKNSNRALHILSIQFSANVWWSWTELQKPFAMIYYFRKFHNWNKKQNADSNLTFPLKIELLWNDTQCGFCMISLKAEVDRSKNRLCNSTRGVLTLNSSKQHSSVVLATKYLRAITFRDISSQTFPNFEHQKLHFLQDFNKLYIR